MKKVETKSEEEKQSVSALPRLDGQESKLVSEYMISLFHILLQYAGGGMEVPLEVLENYPKKLNIVAKYDETNKILRVFIPKKRNRKLIVTPSKKLFVPN